MDVRGCVDRLKTDLRSIGVELAPSLNAYENTEGILPPNLWDASPILTDEFLAMVDRVFGLDQRLYKSACAEAPSGEL